MMSNETIAFYVIVAGKLRVNVLLLHLESLHKIFRQGFHFARGIAVHTSTFSGNWNSLLKQN